MKLDLEYIKGILFVRMSGKLTCKTSYKVKNYLIPIIIHHGIKYMVYNLYNLERIDANGINSLNKGASAIEANQGLVYICEVPLNLKKELNQLNINLVNNELSAIELFNI